MINIHRYYLLNNVLTLQGKDTICDSSNMTPKNAKMCPTLSNESPGEPKIIVVLS